MEISKLTFRRETKEAMEKELTPSEKGELRWKRLQEFEKRRETITGQDP